MFVCGGHGCPCLATQSPRGLVAPEILAFRPGRAVWRGASGDHAEHKRLRHFARFHVEVVFCYLAEQGLSSDILGALWCQEVMPGTAHSFR